jgi:hypothetical protein
MALETSINVCIRNACTTLVFKETTGSYNEITNPTGYGSPNIETTDVVYAVLTIIAPNEQTYNINLFTLDFPSDNPDFEYEIPLSSLGNRSVIEDGYWQFIYTIVDDEAEIHIASKTAVFTCNSQCCINKLLLKINEDPKDLSTINKKRIDNYLKAKAFLESLKHYAYCGNLDKFNNIKLIIDKLCANNNCVSCT